MHQERRVSNTRSYTHVFTLGTPVDSYETIASPQPPQSDAPEAARTKLPKLMPQVPGQHVYAPESSDSHQHLSPVAVGT